MKCIAFIFAALAIPINIYATQKGSNVGECGANKIGNGDIINIRITNDGKLPYDPTTSGFAHITFYNSVLGQLVDLKQNLTTKPSILEKAYWDYKSSSYILKLRSNLKIYRERFATSEDLYFSLVRFFYTSKRADQVAFLRHIEGLEDIKPSTEYKPWHVRGITKVDSLTVKIKLNTPNPSFLYSLSNGWVSLVPIEALEKDFVSWKSVPIGAGPYEICNVKSNNVLLSKKATQTIGPKWIQFVSDRSTSADIVGFDAPHKNNLKKVYGATPIGFTGIFFNFRASAANDKKIRQAIDFALNRDAFSNISPDYTRLDEILTTNFYGRLKMVRQNNIEKAKKLIQQSSAVDLSKTYDAHWFTGRRTLSKHEKAIVDLISVQLQNIGLKVKFSNSTNPTFDPDDTTTLFRVDHRGTAFPDPLVIFRAFEKPAFLSPFYPADNMALKERIYRIAKSKSLDVKAKAINDISKHFWDESILIPLVERKTVFWINPSKVKNLQVKSAITFTMDNITTHSM